MHHYLTATSKNANKKQAKEVMIELSHQAQDNEYEEPLTGITIEGATFQNINNI
jgi:hypothetical protein